MSAVVSLAAAREERTPHLEGRAECAGCRHEWHAVAPVGTFVLSCPSCRTDKGFFANAVLRGEQAWVCNCGSQLFRIAPTVGPYCVNCGDAALGWF